MKGFALVHGGYGGRILSPVAAPPSPAVYQELADLGVTDFVMAPWLQVGGSYDMDLRGKVAACETLAERVLALLLDVNAASPAEQRG